jgi:hypothetical protein
VNSRSLDEEQQPLEEAPPTHTPQLWQSVKAPTHKNLLPCSLPHLLMVHCSKASHVANLIANQRTSATCVGGTEQSGGKDRAALTREK